MRLGYSVILIFVLQIYRVNSVLDGLKAFRGKVNLTTSVSYEICMKYGYAGIFEILNR